MCRKKHPEHKYSITFLVSRNSKCRKLPMLSSFWRYFFRFVCFMIHFQIKRQLYTFYSCSNFFVFLSQKTQNEKSCFLFIVFFLQLADAVLVWVFSFSFVLLFEMIFCSRNKQGPIYTTNNCSSCSDKFTKWRKKLLHRNCFLYHLWQSQRTIKCSNHIQSLLTVICNAKNVSFSRKFNLYIPAFVSF